jgi:transcriptional regulator with XRE-family HTH domain
MTITAARLRAARELVGWSRAKLAKVSNVGGGRITDFETFGRPLSPEAIAAIMGALAVAGLEFDHAGNAVKLRGLSGEGGPAEKTRNE